MGVVLRRRLLLIRLRRNTIRDPSRLSAFLYRTACNLVLIQRRRNARYEHAELADRVDPALSPLVMILRGGETRLLRRSSSASPSQASIASPRARLRRCSTTAASP